MSESDEARSTPQIEKLEVPAAFKPFLNRLSAALVDDQHRPYKLHSARAFNVCLALADGDARVAMRYLDALLDGVEAWNKALDERPALNFPFP